MQEQEIAVMKFGGDLLGDGKKIAYAAYVTNAYAQAGPTIVVASAMKSVTNSLLDYAGQIGQHDQAKASLILSDLTVRHMDTAADLGLDSRQRFRIEEIIRKYTEELQQCLNFPKIEPKQQDYIVAYGERLSVQLLNIAVQAQRGTSIPIDSSTIIVTDDTFGDAKPLLHATEVLVRSKILPYTLQGGIPIVTGYYGATLGGEIATLGRDGSDYTAAIIAYCVYPSVLVFWKNVDGVFDQDPNVFPEAHYYPNLTYEGVEALTIRGAKILHRKAMTPVRLRDIHVWVQNPNNLDFPGTRISASAYSV